MRAALVLRTEMRLTPALVMQGRLLVASATQLDDMVRQELAENPALELLEGSLALEPGYVRIPARKDGLPDIAETMAYTPSPLEQLESEIRLAARTSSEATLAIYLLHSLDSRGYLPKSAIEMASELRLPCEAVLAALEVLQSIGPAGLGAVDLRECLLLQCERLELEGDGCGAARRIIESSWQEFTRQRWQVLSQNLGLSADALSVALRFITSRLHPRPLDLVNGHATGTSYGPPDVVIKRNAGEGPACFSIDLPAARAWRLGVSDGFETRSFVAIDGPRISKEDRAWTQSYTLRARLFIESLEQRWQTLRRIAEYLVLYQAAFLEQGSAFLKPLTRAALARELAIHESTVSRSTRDKTVQMPDGGVIQMKRFFDGSAPAKAVMLDILAGAEKHVSDRDIAERLQAAGISVARRTVSKYRQQLLSVAGSS